MLRSDKIGLSHHAMDTYLVEKLMITACNSLSEALRLLWCQIPKPALLNHG